MKERVSQMFKDKLFLVMLVLGLLTIVAAAGVVTIQRGNGQNAENDPYVEIQDGGLMAEETAPEPTQLAGNSNAKSKTDTVIGETREVKPAETKSQKALTQGEIKEPVAQAGSGKDAATAVVLNFTDTSKMNWPIQGNVLLDYSMESTIFFPTLEQYKCNPGVVIQSDVSTPVTAPADARVMEIGSNEEIGNFVVFDLGNEYTAICGQLKELQVAENEYIEQGQLLGYVAEPTKYYSVEGTNVFFELKHQDKAIDPLDFME